ncbi:RNA polymerase sigma factor [Luethyella okanaganae]|uniref:RNA polymerase sigma factor n=1 Tax=Luethyella okanaganae TaxID=69372 RepID=A0ABW1VC39_9MICO
MSGKPSPVPTNLLSVKALHDADFVAALLRLSSRRCSACRRDEGHPGRPFVLASVRSRRGVSRVVDERADASLWLEATTGTERSFGILFDRYRTRVFRKAYSQLKSVHDAEDVVAVVFLEAWRSRAKVRIVEGSSLPWLLSVTSYVLLNQTRSTRRWRRLLAALPEPELHADHADQVLERADQSEQLRAVYDAMTSLTSQERSIIDLCVIEELPIATGPHTDLVAEAGAELDAVDQVVLLAVTEVEDPPCDRAGQVALVGVFQHRGVQQHGLQLESGEREARLDRRDALPVRDEAVSARLVSAAAEPLLEPPIAHRPG